jgi:hypothetical protein
MPQRYTMRDNGDTTYDIVDDEMGMTIADRVSWGRADYLWHHLNAGVLAVRYTPAGVRLERTDRVAVRGRGHMRPAAIPSERQGARR